MSKTTMITTRVEPRVKKNAMLVLNQLGLSISEAINMFLHQISLHDGLPFEVKVPSKKTQKAMKNALTGKNLKKYASVDNLKAEFE